MSSDTDQDGRRTTLAAVGMLLILVLCCGLPLLIAAGGLGLAAGILGESWLIGLVGLLAVGVVGWRVQRRTSFTEGNGCCLPEPSVGAETSPTDTSTSRPRKG